MVYHLDLVARRTSWSGCLSGELLAPRTSLLFPEGMHILEETLSQNVFIYLAFDYFVRLLQCWEFIDRSIWTNWRTGSSTWLNDCLRSLWRCSGKFKRFGMYKTNTCSVNLSRKKLTDLVILCHFVYCTITSTAPSLVKCLRPVKVTLIPLCGIIRQRALLIQ